MTNDRIEWIASIYNMDGNVQELVDEIEDLKALAKELWAARLPAALGEGTEARILERFPWISE